MHSTVQLRSCTVQRGTRSFLTPPSLLFPARLQPYNLTKFEVVQLINARPPSVVEIHLVSWHAACGGCVDCTRLPAAVPRCRAATPSQRPLCRPPACLCMPVHLCLQCIEDPEERFTAEELDSLLQLIRQHLRDA